MLYHPSIGVVHERVHLAWKVAVVNPSSSEWWKAEPGKWGGFCNRRKATGPTKKLTVIFL